MLLAEGVHPDGRRSRRPTALAVERPGPARRWRIAAVGLLALAATSLWRQDSVLRFIDVVADGLVQPRSATVQIDVADPRPGSASAVESRPTRMEPNVSSIGPAPIVAVTPVAPTVVPTAASTPVPTGPSRDESLPLPPGAAGWQRNFIMSVAPGARESHRKTGVPASVTLAQAILESDWGRSKLTREAKNLFGIKALRGPGSAGVYEIETWEVHDGEDVTVLAPFKAYASLADSIVDHGRWFHDNSRYRKALAVRHDPRAFAFAINEAGYATDPAYAPKLIELMDRFNLYAYDVQPDR